MSSIERSSNRTGQDSFCHCSHALLLLSSLYSSYSKKNLSGPLYKHSLVRTETGSSEKSELYPVRKDYYLLASFYHPGVGATS